ncbi:hypothetical protein BIW11_11021, partial [Tropilaelaps mercedesae]
DKAKNPKAHAMRFAIMQYQDVGSGYFDKSKTFFKSKRKSLFTHSNEVVLNIPPNVPNLQHWLYILDFLRQHTVEEAERIIGTQVIHSEKEAAVFLLQRICAAHNVPGEDVLQRINIQLIRLAETFPLWLLESVPLEKLIG